MKESGKRKILEFCSANGIRAHMLRMYYDLAVDYAKSNNIPYERLFEAAMLYGLPMTISKQNLPELRKKLVLSENDPSVTKVIKSGQRKLLGLMRCSARQQVDIGQSRGSIESSLKAEKNSGTDKNKIFRKNFPKYPNL